MSVVVRTIIHLTPRLVSRDSNNEDIQTMSLLSVANELGLNELISTP